MSALLFLNASLVLARHSWLWWLVHWGMLPCFSSREDSTAPTARWQLLPKNSLQAKAAAEQPLKKNKTPTTWHHIKLFAAAPTCSQGASSQGENSVKGNTVKDQQSSWEILIYSIWTRDKRLVEANFPYVEQNLICHANSFLRAWLSI